MSNAFDLTSGKKLGFGLMRLPKKDGQIDLEATKKLVDRFMERGFTYFDTAYVYDGGNSEIAARECIVKRYPRDSFTIATKYPTHGVAEGTDPLSLFETSRERLGVDYIDYYLLHALNDEKYEKLVKDGVWDMCRKLRDEGKIRHLGFSVHASPEFIDRALTEQPDVEFVQVQINYLDWEDPSVRSRLCYEAVRKHNVPVVIMEPIKGGALAGGNEEITKILKAANPDATPASWALRFAAGHPGIGVVLSGMNEMSQVEENTVVLDDPKPITPEEQKVLDAAVAAYNAIERIPCTRCRYCVDGCPMSIDIPTIFSMVNQYRVYGQKGSGWMRYENMKAKASDCIQCRTCESACPPHITIPELLQEAVKIFE